jgi:hypothetical protein
MEPERRFFQMNSSLFGNLAPARRRLPEIWELDRIDGSGADNSFVADANGNAVVTTVSPAALTHDNAVLVVYHSDGKVHGRSRGDIGVDAHHQLIARP